MTGQAWTMVIVVLYGLLFGSFANVVGYRLPRGESLVKPRSHCVQCQHQLRAWELIPVLSWILLRGHCRSCSARISIRYPAIELAAGALFAATVLTVPTWPARIAWFLFWLLLLSIVSSDMTSMKVPNILSLPGAVCMLMAAVLTGVQVWWMSLLGATACFVVLLALNVFSGGKLGMGDVKLYLSIGAMLGPAHGLESLVIASFAGSLVGLAMRWGGWLGRKQYMPFVPYIVIGVIVMAFFGQTLEGWYVNHVIGWGA